MGLLLRCPLGGRFLFPAQPENFELIGIFPVSKEKNPQEAWKGNFC
jgi:hypothetical protein